MQMSMAGVRFIVVLLMIATAIADIAGHSENTGDGHNDADLPAPFDFNGFGLAMPIIAFALCYQQNMPSLGQYIMHKEYNIPRIFIMATVTVVISYTTLGVLLPIAMDTVEP